MCLLYVKTTAMEILYSPNAFYETLISLITGAQKRVSIATLYIGTGPVEERLLRTISDSGVRSHILIDGLRGNRKERDCRSSISNIRKICPNACIHEHVSEKFSGFAKLLPERIREIVGTQHMKIIVVDDHVIITGANLSDIYFNNRQDRYFVLRNHPSLADSLHEVVVGDGNIIQGKFDVDEQTKISFRVHDPRKSKRDELINSVLGSEPETSSICLSSPYLNLSLDIVELLEKFHHVKIITGSLETNAFHNSQGLSRHIPTAYAIVQEDIPKKFELLEYSRPGWSFHPKGIWITPRGESTPTSTIIGSSNFGYRSLVRDMEITFCMRSIDPVIRGEIWKEWNQIEKFSRPVNSTSRYHSGLLRYLVKKPLRTFL